jgi:hypothetical protein
MSQTESVLGGERECTAGEDTGGRQESGDGVVGRRSRHEVIGCVHKQLTTSIQKWKVGTEQ